MYTCIYMYVWQYHPLRRCTCGSTKIAGKEIFDGFDGILCMYVYIHVYMYGHIIYFGEMLYFGKTRE